MSTILVVERGSESRRSIELYFQSHNIQFEFVSSTEELSSAARHVADYSLVLFDMNAGDEHGTGMLNWVTKLFPALPVIVLSPYSPEHHVQQMLERSGFRTVSKPICSQALHSSIAAVINAGREGVRLEIAIPTAEDTRADCTASETWSQRVESMLVRVGSADVPVLLQGETGVGKEVIARKLHAYSCRAEGPFVKLNCAALPSELVESELFGYERGAFTGAFKSTPGKFEMAHRGTILLDEIGDMDAKLQAKLLQVLQDQEFFRLGAKESSRIDVRVMAASHCDFEKAIQERRFREDLYYRLNIIDIKIPPLRERRSEILPLCEHFLQKHSTTEWPRLEITPILRQVLMEYNWPGNVRELENAMRKYLVLRSPSILAAEIRQRTVRAKTVYVPNQSVAERTTSSDLSVESDAMKAIPDAARWKFDVSKTLVQVEPDREFPVPERPQFEGAVPSQVPNCFPISLQASESALSKVDEARRAAEARAILEALHTSLWNRKRAACLLNVDYKALLYKMKKLGIGEKRTSVS